MSRRRGGGKSLPERTIIHFTDAYMRHLTSMILYTEVNWRMKVY